MGWRDASGDLIGRKAAAWTSSPGDGRAGRPRCWFDNTGMPAIQLTPAQRKAHRADAHHLDPIVMVGGDGLTPAVKKEADAAP